MNFQIIINSFKEIQTKDPIIKIENNTILIKPCYFNYSFLMNIVFLGGSIYALPFEKNALLTIIFPILLCLSFTMIIFDLKEYNSITIDLSSKKLIIQPNIVYKSFYPQRVLHFTEIHRAHTVSNLKTGGFWIRYRRYHLVLALKSKKEIKLLTSNSSQVAIEITNKMNALF